MTASASRRSNAPRIPASSLVGRVAEIAELRDYLRRPETRLLTLTGPGGVGKTRLGLAVAAGVADAFADGIVCVFLAAIGDPGLVPAAIAQALGIRELGSRSPSENLLAHLQDRQLLLVLDNFEHVATAAPFIAELLGTCPDVKVLATSRAPLHLQGEQEFPVPPLALPPRDPRPVGAGPGSPGDAGAFRCTMTQPCPWNAPDRSWERVAEAESVRLFLARARASKPSFTLTAANVPVVAEICRRLDGLPLAIELAAARIKILPPAALLSHLDGTAAASPLPILSHGPDDLPPRQRTLSRTIDWSYNLLAPDEQSLFRRLAVFVGGATPDAIEAVCADRFPLRSAGSWPTTDRAVTPPAAGPAVRDLAGPLLDQITSLVDQSLLQQLERGDAPRFGMLQTMREYARERLANSDEDDGIRDAHAKYYLAFAELAGGNLASPEQRSWLDRLEDEHDNLRAALRWSLDRNDTTGALRLGTALRRFWYVRGHLTEGRRWLDEALAQSGGRTSVRAQALAGAGVLAHYQADLGRAVALCGESLVLARQLDDPAGISAALNGLGLVARSGCNFAAARAMYAESLALARRLGEPSAIAYALTRFGAVAWLEGDNDGARRLFEEGLELARQIGDPQGIADGLRFLGWAARVRGDVETTIRLSEEALAIYRELGDRRGTGAAIYGIAWGLLRRGDPLAARARWLEVFTIFREIGDRIVVAETLEELGDVALANGQATTAIQLVGAAEALREAIGLPRPPAERPDYERVVAMARSRLGDAAFVRARDEGRGMTPEGAVAACLSGALVTGGLESTARPSVSPPRLSPNPRLASGLTAREAEVLRLVALGLSDAQVAEQLVVSRRTVHSHLGAVYAKLSIASRTAAVRFAFDHGLT